MRSFSMLTFAGARDPRVPALGSMEPFKICLFCSNSTNKFYATVTKLIFCPITYCNLQQYIFITHFMVAVHSVLRIILRTLVIFPGQKGEHIHPSNLYTTYFSVCAIGVHPA